MMKCEACMCVVVYIVTVLSHMIFYGAVDRLAQRCPCMFNHLIMHKFMMVCES